MTGRRRCWVVTASVAALAVAAFVIEPAAGWLQFDRGRVTEAWRWFGGHVTHWSLDHLLWDVVMFLVLGLALESRARSRMIGCLVTSAVAIPLAVLLWEPEIATFRGLSGLDSALFTMLVVLLGRDAFARRDRKGLAVLLALVVAFGAKLAYEFDMARTVFVDSSSFEPLPLVHLVGAGFGALFGSIGRRG